MPKNPLLRWLLGFHLLLLVAVTTYCVSQYRDVPLQPSVETTVYSEPMTSGGKIDFLTAYEQEAYSGQIASPENGFRFLVENVDFATDSKPEVFLQVCKKLGLDAFQVKPAVTYRDPYQHVTQQLESPDLDRDLVKKLLARQKELDIAEQDEQEEVMPWEAEDDLADAMHVIVNRSQLPWTPQDLPMLKSWVDDQSRALNLVAKAVRMPVFEIPYARVADSESMSLATQSVPTLFFRSIARGYLSRANYYFGMGESRKALDDVLSCKILGRRLQSLNSSQERLIGIAIETMADSIGVTTVLARQSSQKDLEYFVNEIENLPAAAGLEKCFHHEKIVVLDMIQNAITNLEAVEEVKKLRSLGLDWNLVAKEFGQKYDDFEQPDEFIDMSKTTTKEFLYRSHRSRKLGRMFAVLIAGSKRSLVAAEKRGRCRENVQKMLLAMLRYEKEHGRLPPAYTTDGDGKPLHSWRVLLLPYLGEKELFAKIRLEEPWDSQHNAAFHQACPSVFACPSCKQCSAGQTNYSVVLGEELPFSGSQGTKLKTFGPQSDDMILIVERIAPVGWMDPTQELTQAQAELGVNGPFRDGDKDYYIGSEHDLRSHAGMRNGAVFHLYDDYEKKLFQMQLRGTHRKLNDQQ